MVHRSSIECLNTSTVDSTNLYPTDDDRNLNNATKAATQNLPAFFDGLELKRNKNNDDEEEEEEEDDNDDDDDDSDDEENSRLSNSANCINDDENSTNVSVIQTNNEEEEDSDCVSSCNNLVPSVEKFNWIEDDEDGEELERKGIYCSLPLDRLSGILGSLKLLSSNNSEKTTPNKNLSINKFLCLYCDRTFSSQNLRSKHSERIHQVTKGRRSSARNSGVFTATSIFSGCSFCSSGKFTSLLSEDLTALYSHLIDYHSDKYFGCKICLIRFPLADNLIQHKIDEHDFVEVEISNSLTPLSIEVDFDETKNTKNDESEDEEKSNKPTLRSTSSSRNKQHLLKNEDFLLSRLGLIQNRSPRTRKGAKNRRSDETLNPKVTRSRNGRTSTVPISNVENLEFSTNKILNNKNEQLSSTFDDDFYEIVNKNVRKNLTCHVDGKLESGPASPSPLSPVHIEPNVRSTLVRSPLILDTEIHEATSLPAITAFPTLLTVDQYGTEPCASKIKKTFTKNSWKWKWDFIKKYKYVNEGGKIVKKIKQQTSGFRDLSKLDMWTQLTMRNKHENEKRKIESGGVSEVVREEKRKLVDQLNSILDKRLLPEINLEQNDQRIVKIEPCDDDELRTLPCQQKQQTNETLNENSFIAELNLKRLNREIDLNRPKVVLSGEWARPRCYVCFGCGSRFETLKTIEEHKSFRHPHVYSTHYEIVGRELIERELYKHFYIPSKALQYKTQIAAEKNDFKTICLDDSMDSIASLSPSCSTTTTKSENCDSKALTASISSHSFTPPLVIKCTKCKKECSGTLDLYRHMLDCAGDYAWLLAKKRLNLKYRYFGNRSKRRKGSRSNLGRVYNRPVRRKVEDSDGLRSKDPQLPRPKPSDAESIQRMLANLPPKRACRQIIPNTTSQKKKVRKIIATTAIINSRNTKDSRKHQQNDSHRRTRNSLIIASARQTKSKKIIRKQIISPPEQKQSPVEAIEVSKKENKDPTPIVILTTAKKKSPKINKVTAAVADGKKEIIKKNLLKSVHLKTTKVVKKIKKSFRQSQQKRIRVLRSSISETVEETVEKVPEPVISVVKEKVKLKDKKLLRNLSFRSSKKYKLNKMTVTSELSEPELLRVDEIQPEQQISEILSTNSDSELKKKKKKKGRPFKNILNKLQGKIKEAKIEIEALPEIVIKLPEILPEILIESEPEIPAIIPCANNISDEIKPPENTPPECSSKMHLQIPEPPVVVAAIKTPPSKRRTKKLNDCIAMLAGKLQQKLGIPFLDTTATNSSLIISKPIESISSNDNPLDLSIRSCNSNLETPAEVTDEKSINLEVEKIIIEEKPPSEIIPISTEVILEPPKIAKKKMNKVKFDDSTTQVIENFKDNPDLISLPNKRGRKKKEAVQTIILDLKTSPEIEEINEIKEIGMKIVNPVKRGRKNKTNEESDLDVSNASNVSVETVVKKIEKRGRKKKEIQTILTEIEAEKEVPVEISQFVEIQGAKQPEDLNMPDEIAALNWDVSITKDQTVEEVEKKIEKRGRKKKEIQTILTEIEAEKEVPVKTSQLFEIQEAKKQEELNMTDEVADLHLEVSIASNETVEEVRKKIEKRGRKKKEIETEKEVPAEITQLFETQEAKQQEVLNTSDEASELHLEAAIASNETVEEIGKKIEKRGRKKKEIQTILTENEAEKQVLKVPAEISPLDEAISDEAAALHLDISIASNVSIEDVVKKTEKRGRKKKGIQTIFTENEAEKDVLELPADISPLVKIYEETEQKDLNISDEAATGEVEIEFSQRVENCDEKKQENIQIPSIIHDLIEEKKTDVEMVASNSVEETFPADLLSQNQKNKRGRKKKITEFTDLDSETPSSEIPKKKRGRKKKQTLVVNELLETPLITEREITPKEISFLEDERNENLVEKLGESYSEIVPIEPSNSESEVTPQKKKKEKKNKAANLASGSSKKSDLIEDNFDHLLDTLSSEPSVKKRGRKKKEIRGTEDSLENSISEIVDATLPQISFESYVNADEIEDSIVESEFQTSKDLTEAELDLLLETSNSELNVISTEKVKDDIKTPQTKKRGRKKKEAAIEDLQLLNSEVVPISDNCRQELEIPLSEIIPLPIVADPSVSVSETTPTEKKHGNKKKKKKSDKLEEKKQDVPDSPKTVLEEIESTESKEPDEEVYKIEKRGRKRKVHQEPEPETSITAEIPVELKKIIEPEKDIFEFSDENEIIIDLKTNKKNCEKSEKQVRKPKTPEIIVPIDDLIKKPISEDDLPLIRIQRIDEIIFTKERPASETTTSSEGSTKSKQHKNKHKTKRIKKCISDSEMSLISMENLRICEEEIPEQNSEQEISETSTSKIGKPRKRRKNELAAIIADQLLESFKEVDKSSIDKLKNLHDLSVNDEKPESPKRKLENLEYTMDCPEIIPKRRLTRSLTVCLDPTEILQPRVEIEEMKKPKKPVRKIGTSRQILEKLPEEIPIPEKDILNEAFIDLEDDGLNPKRKLQETKDQSESDDDLCLAQIAKSLNTKLDEEADEVPVDDNTNTELVDMDLEDDVSVFTSLSLESSFTTSTSPNKGRKRRGRKSINLLKKKTKPEVNDTDEEFLCEICNKTFRKMDLLIKHRRTITHIAKLSEQEFLQSKETVPEEIPEIIEEPIKTPEKIQTPVIETISSPEQIETLTLSHEQRLFFECCNMLKGSDQKFNSNKPVTPKSPYLPEMSHNNVYSVKSPMSHSRSSPRPAFPKIDNQFSDISSDSNQAYKLPSIPLMAGAKEPEKERPIASAYPENSMIIGTYSDVFSDMGDSFPSSQDVSESENYIQRIMDRSETQIEGGEIPSPISSPNYDSERIIEDSKIYSDRSPIYSNSSQSSSASKMLTKGALKGFGNFKVSIPTNGIDLELALVKTSHIGSKLAALADIALGNDLIENEEEEEEADIPIEIEENEVKEVKNTKKKEFGNRLGFKAKKKTKINKKLKKSSVKKTNNPLDIYDFEDSQDSTDQPIIPLSKFNKPIQENDDDNDDEEQDDEEEEEVESELEIPKKSTELMLPSPPIIQEDSQMSSTSFSDRDEFNYGAASCLSDSDTSSSISSKKKLKKLPDTNNLQKKCLIMGRIFKNAKKIEPIDEKIDEKEKIIKKQIPKKELDKLFDSLKVAEENNLEENENENENESEITENRNELRRSKKSREIQIMEAEWGMSLEQIKEIIGVGQRKSKRKCAAGKQKILAETWSSDEYEDFHNTKDIIALIQETELKAVQRRNRNNSKNSRKENETEELVKEIEEIKEPSPPPPQQPLPPIVNSEQKRSSKIKQRRTTICKTKTKKDDSESDFEDHWNKTGKRSKIKKRRKTIAFRETEIEKTDDVKTIVMSDSEKKPKIKEKIKKDETNRRKRIASEQLYYWSESSDEEFGRIKTDRDDYDDDDMSQGKEPFQQHGWICGDSHKKLVTLLAHAKGKKIENCCGVKETGNKKKS